MRPAVDPKRLGFTLIELLVVIAIISILSVAGFVNYRNFSADQVTNKAAGDVKSILRLAQSNSTSSTACGALIGGVSWAVIFNSDALSIGLVCGPANSLQRTYTLDNAQIQIKGSSCATSSTLPITVTYPAGVGSLTFGSSDPCLVSSPTLSITVSNTRDTTASPKSFKISKGGAIDVQ